jgi:TonB family protein
MAGFCQDNAKKLSRAEALASAVDKVQPDFPAMARQLKIEGQVELEALVSETGTVEKVNIVSGNPILTRPAADALKRWKFSPATADGKPVKALAPVLFTFKK